MTEIVVNLHMHTRYSDGSGTHAEIAKAALRCGLDAVIVTDHNVYVEGPEGYYTDGERRVLLLVGEEIHDPARSPQKSHLLVFGAGEDFSHLASDLDKLIRTIIKNHGLAFAAHPFDPAAPLVQQEDLSWEDWQIAGLTGLEIWNGDSEYKSLLTSWPKIFFYTFFPNRIPVSPFPQTLKKWDERLEAGQKLTAIGGSDAHAFDIRKGLIHRIIFPYDYHFRTINTHVLIQNPLSGDVKADQEAIYDAIRHGSCYIANDLPASGKGFSFTAHGYGRKVEMGMEISAERGVTFQVRLPSPAEVRLIRYGQVVETWHNHTSCTFIATQPGAYRVEAYIQFLGRLVGWIFSNPIYVRA